MTSYLSFTPRQDSKIWNENQIRLFAIPWPVEKPLACLLQAGLSGIKTPAQPAKSFPQLFQKAKMLQLS